MSQKQLTARPPRPGRWNRLHRLSHIALLLPLLVLVPSICGGGLLMAQELERPATWQPWSNEQVVTVLRDWYRQAEKEAAFGLSEFESRVNQHAGGMSGVVLEEISRLFPFAAETIELFGNAPVAAADWQSVIDPVVLLDPRLPESAQVHLRLVAGCWFARHQRYDEAGELLSELSVEQVMDPAALLFYSGMSWHRLLKTSQCQAALQQLLENEDRIPRRFAVIAGLMIADLQTLEAGSLDEISRMMEDIRRRQALHRSGTRVIDEEKQVIEKLDKLIDEIEKQLQQQARQQASAQPSGSPRPMEDSQNAGGRGQGEVTDRQLGEGGSWGSLPPKKRAAALAEMARDLPPHYREVIEEYFRQLARVPKN